MKIANFPHLKKKSCGDIHSHTEHHFQYLFRNKMLFEMFYLYLIYLFLFIFFKLFLLLLFFNPFFLLTAYALEAIVQRMKMTNVLTFRCYSSGCI